MNHLLTKVCLFAASVMFATGVFAQTNMLIYPGFEGGNNANYLGEIPEGGVPVTVGSTDWNLATSGWMLDSVYSAWRLIDPLGQQGYAANLRKKTHGFMQAVDASTIASGTQVTFGYKYQFVTGADDAATIYVRLYGINQAAAGQTPTTVDPSKANVDPVAGNPANYFLLAALDTPASGEPRDTWIEKQIPVTSDNQWDYLAVFISYDNAANANTYLVDDVTIGLPDVVADAGPDQLLIDGDGNGVEMVNLDGSGSFSRVGNITSYLWEEGESTLSTVVSPSLSVNTGEHTYTLTVMDDQTNSSTDTVVITVRDGSPIADAGNDQRAPDNDGNGSEQITLDASGSFDPDGTIVSYTWKQGSTTIATGINPTVTLPVGEHTITLECLDDAGLIDSDEMIVKVLAIPSLLGNEISEYKSGISLEVNGIYGLDYLVENWYHDPKIDPRCTIYIRSDAMMNFFHNARNSVITGESQGDYIMIGVNGQDGVPNSGDEGIIRYRVDQEMTERAKWADYSRLYPEWTDPMSFDDMEYDPNYPVVGVTGPLPTAAITDQANFYWRGMTDNFGDEWHVIAVGDDDSAFMSYYATYSSDGKIYYFVVNPKTPNISFTKNDDDAQFYTRPPKNYFIPVIRDQISYILGDIDIELAALDNPQVQYSLEIEGQSENWQVYTSPINTIAAGLQSDTRYALKYRIGNDGPVKTRIVHFDPGFPSDAEQHPKNILWKGESDLQAIRNRIKDPAPERQIYRDEYDDYLHNSFDHQRDGYYQATLYTGDRWVGVRMSLLASAFPLLVDGFDQHSNMTQFLKVAMLDNSMNLDQVGGEHVWAQNSPTREINMQGYYSITVPLANAFAYDWVIKDLRKGLHPDGFTAVEDYKMRDNLAKSAVYAVWLHNNPYTQVIDANGYNIGMWNNAWLQGAHIISAIMDEYDNDLYGTSGAPTGSTSANHTWAPFPDQPVTWWDVAADKNHPTPGYPNLNVKSGMWGLLNENLEWRDRRGYWGGSMMGWLYYLTVNFRVNYDGYRYPHLEEGIKKIAEGGQIFPMKSPAEGPLEFYTAMMVNHNFPEIAPVELEKLALGTDIYEKSIGFSLGVRGPLGICLYEDDWDTYEEPSEVISRSIFYNNSSYDGNDPAANVADLDAIAPDKHALLPGGTATFASYTSYDKGINGIIIELPNASATISDADFEFKVGNDNNPSGWTTAPAPTSITIEENAGILNSDLIKIIWADGAISKQWLQVTVKSNANTGLTTADIFYFGNAIGDTGDSASNTIVDATDEVGARNNPRNFMRPATIDNVYDHNRDGKVNATDEIISRNNVTDFSNDLELISP